jgi:hypothetical protein
LPNEKAERKPAHFNQSIFDRQETDHNLSSREFTAFKRKSHACPSDNSPLFLKLGPRKEEQFRFHRPCGNQGVC